MTLQASGAITLSQLRGEFGGSVPDSLSEYYRNGSLVPNLLANAAVPTSGAIALSNFYSTRANPIATVARTYSAFNVFIKSPVTAIIELQHLTDGDLVTAFSGTGSSGTPNSNEWHRDVSSSGVGNGWEMRYTLTAGDALNVGSLTAGTWYRINATRTLGNSHTGTSGQRSSTLTIDYREFGGPGTIIHTVTGIVLTASVL